MELMKNEPKDEQEIKDYRFILYRIDQLEINEKENFKELMKMLQVMQQGQNEHNKTIIEINQRMYAVEEKTKCIDKLKEAATKRKKDVVNINRRLDIYRAVLIGVAITFLATVVLTVTHVI